MVLSGVDRSLLQRCLSREDRSWEDFVDRYLGLVIHVINHTAQVRSLQFGPEDREDLSAEVFLAILKDDLAVLRAFRGQCSLATYLTVVARRVVVRQITKNQASAPLRQAFDGVESIGSSDTSPEQRISDRDQVQRLLDGLAEQEAEVVRLYHLEGRSYQEISSRVGLPENSIGPTLSRARAKLRRSSP